MATKKLGTLLEEKGLINEFQLVAALSHQRKWKSKLGQSLIELGYLEEEQLYQVLAEQMEMEFVELQGRAIPLDILKCINKDFAKEWLAIPFEFDGSSWKVAVAEPDKEGLEQAISEQLGGDARLVLATPTDVDIITRKIPDKVQVASVQPVKKAFVKDENGIFTPVEGEPVIQQPEQQPLNREEPFPRPQEPAQQDQAPGQEIEDSMVPPPEPQAQGIEQDKEGAPEVESTEMPAAEEEPLEIPASEDDAVPLEAPHETASQMGSEQMEGMPEEQAAGPDVAETVSVGDQPGPPQVEETPSAEEAVAMSPAEEEAPASEEAVAMSPAEEEAPASEEAVAMPPAEEEAPASEEAVAMPPAEADIYSQEPVEVGPADEQAAPPDISRNEAAGHDAGAEKQVDIEELMPPPLSPEEAAAGPGETSPPETGQGVSIEAPPLEEEASAQAQEQPLSEGPGQPESAPEEQPPSPAEPGLSVPPSDDKPAPVAEEDQEEGLLDVPSLDSILGQGTDEGSAFAAGEKPSEPEPAQTTAGEGLPSLDAPPLEDVLAGEGQAGEGPAAPAQAGREEPQASAVQEPEEAPESEETPLQEAKEQEVPGISVEPAPEAGVADDVPDLEELSTMEELPPEEVTTIEDEVEPGALPGIQKEEAQDVESPSADDSAELKEKIGDLEKQIQSMTSVLDQLKQKLEDKK